MKKINCLITFFICFNIIFLSCSFVGYAFEEEFCIEDYSIYDLSTMSTKDKIELLEAFKEEYNPFNINDYTISPEQLNVGNIETTISPQWTSGNVTSNNYGIENAGTHELMTLDAIELLIKRGYFITNDDAEALFISMLLAVASALPDRELDGIGFIYAGHFYNPETERNWMFSSSNTARTNFEEEFLKARELFNEVDGVNLSSDDYTEAIEYIGRALHYLQDACEPHHTNNVIAGIFPTSHSEFEEYVFVNYDNFNRTIYWDYSMYADMREYNLHNIDEIVHLVAVESYPYIELVNDKDDQSDWGYVGSICKLNTVKNSAAALMIMFDYCEELIAL